MYNALCKYKYKGNICMLYFLIDALVGCTPSSPDKLSVYSVAGAPWRHTLCRTFFHSPVHVYEDLFSEM